MLAWKYLPHTPLTTRGFLIESESEVKMSIMKDGEKGKKARNKFGLTSRQEEFARLIGLEGKTSVVAYREAYNSNANDSCAKREAWAMLKDDKINNRIETYQKRIQSVVVWEKVDMVKQLKKIADDCDLIPQVQAKNTAIKAIEAGANILGYNKQTIEHQGGIKIFIDEALKEFSK